MQSSQQVEEIVQSKVHSVSNKKVIHDMQTAIDVIKKEDVINVDYATFGLTIILPLVLYLSYLVLL